MKRIFLSAVTTLFFLSVFPACTSVSADAIPPIGVQSWAGSTKKTMRPFRSEAELLTYLKQLAEKQRTEMRRAQQKASENVASTPASAPVGLASSADKDDSVTNVQHAGVDEGGIVKVHGNHLVILRRGRLFTVKLGDGSLQPVSAVDAFGPDIEPGGTWYDEMLVSEDSIVVIGYSYQRGGTEIGLFNINDAGQISYRSTHHLRSNDYYSSRNYASRLIGIKLIFYTPLYLNPGAEDPFQSFPAVRRWHKGAGREGFKRIVSATSVYRSEQEITSPYGLALHTVTVCDLADGFSCKATAVLGPMGRVFYVSPDSVYVWVSDWARRNGEHRTQSQLYRMPLDGSGPAALVVSGSPIDQFSFLESADRHINVLVRSESRGDAMWAAEGTAGDVALLRVPVSNFSDGSQTVPAENYRSLRKPKGYTFQNRFVGQHLLYGTGSGWGYPSRQPNSELFAVRWSDRKSAIDQLSLPHGVDRIEQMGEHAVVIGTDGKNLHFSSVRLGPSAEVAGRYTREGASQGELRSHGFFYKPDGTNTGTLGLPISRPGRPGYHHLFESSAAILFLRNDDLEFQIVGELGARPERAVDDACRASCVDWYGNARPLFVRGRVLALLGYEIVEGFRDDGRIHEMRRVNYAPNANQITRR